MKINAISISRVASYEKTTYQGADFKANVQVASETAYNASINIGLTEDQIEPVVGIIAAAVSKNMADAAASFHKEVVASIESRAASNTLIEQQEPEYGIIPTDVDDMPD